MKFKLKLMKKRTKIVTAIAMVFIILLGNILWSQFVYIDGKDYVPAKNTSKNFRVALSVSPFSAEAIKKGYIYHAGNITAKTQKELEQMYIKAGATEMYTRIGTKRYPTKDDLVDGKVDTNANYHTLQQGLELCKLAAELKIPINPEIMCAYTYMDMDTQQEPRFEEYPDIYKLQKGKKWAELTLDEMCTVLQAYGKFIATEILKTGCAVDNWNIGNEANYGFAGVGVGLKTAVNPKLANVPKWMKYILPMFGNSWLENNLWKYNAKEMAAVQKGVLSAYKDLKINSSNVQFSTHIATVVSNTNNATAYFNTLKENGYHIDLAGISYYPSAPAVYLNKTILYKKIVTAINTKCKLPVFIAEFSYPSGSMTGPFAGWSKKANNYALNENGQAEIYNDVIQWGKTHGLAGIRYWAPDYKGWSSMSMFNFKGKNGTAKKILMQDLESRK